MQSAIDRLGNIDHNLKMELAKYLEEEFACVSKSSKKSLSS